MLAALTCMASDTDISASTVRHGSSGIGKGHGNISKAVPTADSCSSSPGVDRYLVKGFHIQNHNAILSSKTIRDVAVLFEQNNFKWRENVCEATLLTPPPRATALRF